ncbi:MAG: hypothetical protein U0R19_23650 [Bryobacteraceae bacterium]
MQGLRYAIVGIVGCTLLLPVFAQRAQLPTKGRRQEKSAPRQQKAIRVLPRRGETADAMRFPERAPTEYQLSLSKSARPKSALPADRVRTLVRRSTDSFAPIPPLQARTERTTNPLPKPNQDPIELPTFVYPADPNLTASVPNRWEITMPEPRRYEDGKLDSIYARNRWWDPFNRNRLKGDLPILGRKYFLNITALSDTVAEGRRLPLPAVASAASSNDYKFFGRGGQFALRESFRVSFDFFKGSAGFRPVDFEIRITPEFNINYLLARENAITRIDVRQGLRRTDTNVSLQEAFIEKRLFTNARAAFRKAKDSDDRGSARFDFTSVRVGIQRFTSDFRGFVFSDEQPGARLFGTFKNNILQYNLAYFNLLEKDTNSGLNRWRQRNQSVYAANLYWNDFLTPGYNLNFSALYNNDQPKFHIDKNGFLVRPAPIGFPIPNKVRAGYAGISGDGHIGRFNVSHSFYQAFGRHDFNTISARPLNINAQMAAAEIAYEKDWAIFKVSGFFSSGDNDITDGSARGFDAIVPNQQFAGGGFLGSNALADRGLINPLFDGGGTNFLNRQPIPLTGTGVFLFGPNSLIPSMRAGLFQGQANFVNPGIMLLNAGMDAKLTPKLRSTINVNYARFHRTEVLEAVLFQNSIPHPIGVDTGMGLQYRPLLSDNVVFTGGAGFLAPMSGFKNLYTGRTLLSGFVALRILF